MPRFWCLFPKILWMWLFFTCLMSRQEKREVRGTEGGNVCHFKGNETTTHILFTFQCLSRVTVHHVAVNKTRCLNLQYKHLYVCAIEYLSTMYTPRFRKFLSVFTFRHIVYFNLQVFSSSDLHWNTSISFQCSSVHVVHSYDVQEQNNFLRSSSALFRAAS